MKRHLYTILKFAGVAAIIVTAMVSGAAAQTMGEYGAATAASGGISVGSDSMDTQTPGTVWAGASQFPAENQQLSDQSQFPDTSRFDSNDASGSSGRFSTGDRFSTTSPLDSQSDRFGTDDRWSQDSWGK